MSTTNQRRGGLAAHGGVCWRAHYLSQPLLVANDKGRKRRVDVDVDVHALVECVHLDDFDCGVQHVVQVEHLRLELHLASCGR